ncbi:MAG TPA: hypothetical protein VGQ85_07630 [Candidatus Limnocylindrales bacterium]|nr:hypothetical protein [Candidatus Limnocylindrales bacterium]
MVKIEAAAHGAAGYVLVGAVYDRGIDRGLAMRSIDGTAWTISEDPHLAGVYLTKVISSKGEFIAVGAMLTAGSEAVVLTSADGVAWTLRYSGAGSGAYAIATDQNLSLVIASSDDGDRILSSPDGKTWVDRRAASLGFSQDAHLRGIAFLAGTWLLVGSIGNRAAAWRSADGVAWHEMPLSGGTPIAGLESVEVDQVVANGDRAIAIGTDNPHCNTPSDESCPRFGAGWVLAAGSSSWDRLPASSVLSQGWGGKMWASDVGFLYLGSDALLESADGWTWRPIATDRNLGFLDALSIDGQRFVAAGLDVTSAPRISNSFAIGTLIR